MQLDLADTGAALSPAAWHAALEDDSEPKLVLDMRNWYESEAGSF
jgi:predicted sulfurtransferase